MKKLIFLLFIILFYDSASSQFEGTLLMKVKKYTPETGQGGDKTKPGNDSMIFHLGINEFKVETGDYGIMGGSFIINLSKKNIILLSDNEKKYFQLPFSFFKEMSALAKNMGVEDSTKKEIKKKVDIKNTWEKKTIEGFPCVKYIINEEDVITEAWVTLKFTNFFKSFSEVGAEILSGGGASDLGDDFFIELANKGGFPLHIIEKDKNGNPVTETTVSVIIKKRFDKSFFTPPKDYRKADMEK